MVIFDIRRRLQRVLYVEEAWKVDVGPRQLGHDIGCRRTKPVTSPTEARAGEALLLHNHVWHRSSANATSAPRRAFTVCYMDARTRCLRRKRAPRSFVEVFP